MKLQAFCVRLLSFTLVFGIHVFVACISHVFLFIAEYHSIEWVFQDLFIHVIGF